MQNTATMYNNNIQNLQIQQKNIELAEKIYKSSKAKYDQETGKLEWDITLKPKETKKISFTYEVKIPKDKVIAGL